MQKPMDDSYKLYINGTWTDGNGSKTFVSSCPANGESLATCVEACKEDVDDAVEGSMESLGEMERCEPAGTFLLAAQDC